MSQNEYANAITRHKKIGILQDQNTINYINFQEKRTQVSKSPLINIWRSNKVS